MNQPTTPNTEARMTTDEAREYLVEYMMANFSDKTFHRYIRGNRNAINLAGDFAWQLATALKAGAGRNAQPEQPASPTVAGSVDTDEFRKLLESLIDTHYKAANGDASWDAAATADANLVAHITARLEQSEKLAPAAPSGEAVRALAEKWNAQAIKDGFAGSEAAHELFDVLDATHPAPSSLTAPDELHFNAQRLRNVAALVGLSNAVPEDDATLDGARGAVLGQIAAKLRPGLPAQAVPGLTRYDMETKDAPGGWSSDTSMAENKEGDWVRYEDMIAALKGTK